MRTQPQGAVLVTGASSGIGRACALHLDQAGYRVFATVRQEKDAESLRQAASDRLTPEIQPPTLAGRYTCGFQANGLGELSPGQ